MLQVNNIICLVLIVLSINTSYGAVDVKIKYLEGEFTKEEKDLIQKASEMTFSRLIKAHIANCLYREAYRPVQIVKGRRGKRIRKTHSKDQLRKAWSYEVAFLNKFKKFSLNIRKKDLKGRRLGQAKLGIARIDRKNYQLLDLEITLDIAKIKAYKREASKKDDLDIWVNTIAHEIAHNLGYSHTSGHSWEEDYPGFVPTEVGFCVMTDGRYGSHLGDRGKMRQRMKKNKKRL